LRDVRAGVPYLPRPGPFPRGEGATTAHLIPAEIDVSLAVFTTFVTALEREDIDELSNALYKIPKTEEKFCERVLFSRSSGT
jgi:uncharacterized protein